LSDPSAVFKLEWMGGAAEHHYRRARKSVDDLPWDTLDVRRYPPALVAASRRVWTNVALSEYAAVVQFSEVVAALARARAPLDLIGMTSDFVADEVRHVELASRMTMQLGGAAPLPFDASRLSLSPAPQLSPLQKANELALRVGTIGEGFAGGTASRLMEATRHPLVREVYAQILRDEARHLRFGGLYFDWAKSRMDDAERSRLSDVALRTLKSYAGLWQTAREAPARVAETQRAEDYQELGWLDAERYDPLAISVVRDELVPTLRALGLHIPDCEVDALAPPPPDRTL
jgi:hypothetical protein